MRHPLSKYTALLDINPKRKGDGKMTEEAEGEEKGEEPAKEETIGVGEKEGMTALRKGGNQMKVEKRYALVKFEIDERDLEDAETMSKMIARAENLKKDTRHAAARFLFEQCIAEYRAKDMLKRGA